MMIDQIAKVVLTAPDRIRFYNDEIYLTSYAKYDNEKYMVMAQDCPLCGVYHDEYFELENDTACLICPNTGVKIYAIYS